MTQIKRLTPEELLRPRIKCIADFWDNPFKVGEVIQFIQEREYHDFFTGELQGKDWLTDFLPDDPTVIRYMYWMRKFTPLPHLFRRLEWWEERDVKDMPEYVKTIYDGRVRKVNKYDFKNNIIWMDYSEGNCQFTLNAYLSARLPATKQDYLTYTSNQK